MFCQIRTLIYIIQKIHWFTLCKIIKSQLNCHFRYKLVYWYLTCMVTFEMGFMPKTKYLHSWWPFHIPHINRSMFAVQCWIEHDDVIKWKHFPRYWPFVRGIQRSPVNSPHKGQWRGALMFSLICVWINGWINNREAGDFRRYRVHYDVTVMINHVPNTHARFNIWY